MATEERTDIDGDPYETDTVEAEIELRVDTSTRMEEGEMVYRLLIQVVSATNISDAIFVFEHIPSVAGGEADLYRFVTVATPVHMAELPEDAATPESGNMCRLALVDLEFRSSNEMITAREAILRRVNALATNKEAMTEMQQTMVVTYTFDVDA